jgi:hypothetical protein
VQTVRRGEPLAEDRRHPDLRKVDPNQRSEMMRAAARFLLIGPILFLASACASGPSSGAPPPDRYVITLAEIQATEAETAYQIIQQLRPRWFVRNRGVRTFAAGGEATLRVVVDELPPRELEFLYQLPREILQELRFLDAREATFKYGTGHDAGIIEVTTRR